MLTSKCEEPSVCIPHARHDTTKLQVKEVFEKIFGSNSIKIIDECIFRSQHNQAYYKRYFIHFNYWNSESEPIRRKFIANDEIKIIYSEPYFWKCSALRKRKNKHLPNPRPVIPTPLNK